MSSVIGLKTSSDATGGRRSAPRIALLTLLLCILTAIAAYIWIAPRWQEQSLQSASLETLKARAAATPENPRVQYHLGRRLLAAGDAPQAFEALTKAADSQPGDFAVWKATAEAATAVNGPRGGMNLLGAFIKNNPKNIEARIALVQSYMNVGAYRMAYSEAKKATDLAPGSAVAWRLRGVNAIASENSPDADKALRKALALAPADAENQAALGNALSLQGKWKEAVPFYREAGRLRPDDPMTMTSLARTLLSVEASPANLQEAQQLLQRSVSLKDDLPVTQLYLGRTFAAQGNWQEARTALERAVTLDPTTAEPYFDLARACERLGDKPAAEATRKKHDEISRFLVWRDRTLLTLSHTGDSEEGKRLRLELARGYFVEGRFSQAVEQYRRLLELSPDREDIRAEAAAAEQNILPVGDLVVAGDAALAHDKNEDAERLYFIALKRDTKNARSWEGVGLALARQGKLTEGIRFLTEATRLDPTRTAAQIALAQANVVAGELPEAYRRAEAVTQADPKNVAAWNMLGDVASQVNKKEEAEAAFQRAVALDPNNPTYLMNLGDVQFDTNRREEAEASYRKAATLAPDDAELQARFGGMLMQLPPNPARRREAEQLLRAALAKNPADEYAQYNLGKLLLDNRQVKEAIPMLEKAVAGSATMEKKEVWYSLGRAYRTAGDTAKAKAATDRATQMQKDFDNFTRLKEQIPLTPRDPKAHLALARAFAAREQYADSLREYAIAYHLAPKDAEAKIEAEMLEKRLRANGKMPDMTLLTAILKTQSNESSNNGAIPKEKK